MKLSILCICAALACGQLAVYAATGPEDKAAYEKALSEKADGALSLLLGRGKARTMVRAEAAEAGGEIKKHTVVLALSASVPEADSAKAAETLFKSLSLDAARGDEVLVFRTAFPPEGAEHSAGLADYAWQGFLVVIGMFIAFFFSRVKKTVEDEKNVTARRAPAAGLAPREKYVPPPAQPQQAKNGESDELNIPSRSGFYKR